MCIINDLSRTIEDKRVVIELQKFMQYAKSHETNFYDMAIFKTEHLKNYMDKVEKAGVGPKGRSEKLRRISLAMRQLADQVGKEDKEKEEEDEEDEEEDEEHSYK